MEGKMMRSKQGLLTLGIFIAPLVGWAGEFDLDYEWQRERLLSPNEQERESEKAGRVFIYHGLKDSDVELALNEHPHRIEHMMFVNTVHTDENGDPIIDTETGEPVMDDDC
jgi:hypothetical protein